MIEKFKDFNHMITSDIIKFVYWIMMGIVLVGGTITSLLALATGSLLSFLFSLVVIVMSVLWVRITCELIILGFKIHDYLKEINNKLKV